MPQPERSRSPRYDSRIRRDSDRSHDRDRDYERDRRRSSYDDRNKSIKEESLDRRSERYERGDRGDDRSNRSRDYGRQRDRDDGREGRDVRDRDHDRDRDQGKPQRRHRDSERAERDQRRDERHYGSHDDRRDDRRNSRRDERNDGRRDDRRDDRPDERRYTERRNSEREADNDRDRRYNRGREASPERRRRSMSESSDELLDLKELGVSQISEEDYFLKSDEFRFWLKEERGKYIDQLSSEHAHKYFRRFVRRWNDGALPRECYLPHDSTGAKASSNTAYKWSFASHRSRVNSQELTAAREDVDRLTHAKGGKLTGPSPLVSSHQAEDDADDIGPQPDVASTSRSPTPGPRPVGPTVPTMSDRQLAREAAKDAAKAEHTAQRKAERKTALDRAEDLVPRAGPGREGKMAERRAVNEANKQMRDKDVAGLEIDDGTLMGDDSGFAAAIRARDASAARRAEKRAEQMADQRSVMEERLVERRQKESETMDMLKAIAKQRFG